MHYEPPGMNVHPGEFHTENHKGEGSGPSVRQPSCVEPI